MKHVTARERELLIELALYLSPVWEEDNEDDRDSATLAVDAFLRGEER